MAWAFKTLDGGATNADLTSYSTAGNATPDADSLVVVAVVASVFGNDSTGDDPLEVTGYGLTFSKVRAGITYTDASLNMRATTSYWVAKQGASPVAGNVTADFTTAHNQTGCSLSVFDLTGYDNTGTAVDAILQKTYTGETDETGLATSLTLTLPAAPIVGNAIISAISHAANEVSTEGAGMTEIHDLAHPSPPTGTTSMVRLSEQQSASASWATLGECGGQLFEVKAATTAQSAAAETAIASFSGIDTGISASAAQVAEPASAGFSALDSQAVAGPVSRPVESVSATFTALDPQAVAGPISRPIETAAAVFSALDPGIVSSITRSTDPATATFSALDPQVGVTVLTQAALAVFSAVDASVPGVVSRLVEIASATWFAVDAVSSGGAESVIIVSSGGPVRVEEGLKTTRVGKGSSATGVTASEMATAVR